MSHTRLPTRPRPAKADGTRAKQVSTSTAESATSARVVAARSAAPSVQLPQLKAKVSRSGEPMEREADLVAGRVTSGASPSVPVAVSTRGPSAQRQAGDEEEVQRQAGDEEEVQRQAGDEEEVQRQAGDEEEVQRQAGDDEEVQRQAGDEEEVQRKEGSPGRGAPTVTARTASTISNPGSGAPLAPSVRSSIEPHLGANLGGVRVHTDANAAHAATSLQARAFTVGNNIFLNRSESALNLGLMAHESTHVVQQGAARSHSPHVARSADDEIQRLPDFITDRLASYARHVPGYTLFTVVIGFNPLTGRSVERTAINLVEGMMGLVPFGTFIFDELNELGILQDAFTFINQQLATFDLSLERLERTISDAWDEMDFIRLDPFDYNIGVLRRHAGLLLDDVTGFATSLVNRIIELIKEAVLDVAEGLLAENQAWALLKKVLKWDPLNGEPVESTTVEIIEDFLILIGKETELEQMRARGTVEKTAQWIDTQLATFTGLISELGSLFGAAWDAIQPENLPNLGANLEALVVRAGTFIQNVWDFAITVAEQVLQLIKDALLGWLSGFAHEIPGFHLLTVLLGRNPFTEEAVPRTAVNIIRGFISLLPGGNEMYDKLAETGVIAEAGAAIEGAISELGISWDFIVGIFVGIWDGLSIDDLIDPIGAFQRIVAQFGEPISRLFSFIKTVIVEVFKLILALMNFPTDLLARIISNVVAAITDIMRDPIGFLINMLEALKLGFTNFFNNFLTHLVNGLVDWLFGGLRAAGIEPPTDLSFASILDTVLQVLGISMERIWEKLAERFGQDTIDKVRGALDRLVGIWNVVNDVMERGVVAIWEYIESQLSNLWDMVLGAATEWIMETIISRVVTKLLSMLDPTGIMAVVNGFIAFFNAVQSAIEYIREILEIIDSYVATFAAVAAGDIEPGAARMEGGLAAVIPVALGFLANQVGLGNIGEKIAEIVEGVREVVDQALDWLLDQLEGAIASIQSLFGMGGGEDDAQEAEATEEAGVDPANHQAFAEHALERLRTAERPDEGTPFERLQAAAARLQPSLSSQLEDGVGLTFSFPGGVKDAEDGTVQASVTIAPNNTQLSLPFGLAAAPVPNPPAPAPGIGVVGSHGEKPSSNRAGPRIHWTTSEHMIPYAVGRAFIEEVAVLVDETNAGRGIRHARGGKLDKAQTTIMIYYGAATEKTTIDYSVIEDFKRAARELRIAQDVQRDQIEAGGGEASVDNSPFGELVRTWSDVIGNDAITRTKNAITAEMDIVESPWTERNADRRGETQENPPLPTVDGAVTRQRQDIRELALLFISNLSDHYGVETLTMDTIRTASRTQLLAIRAIGPKLADAIIAARPIPDKDALSRVHGIGPAFLERVSD